MTETLTTAPAVPATFAGRRYVRAATALASSGLLVGMGAVSASPALAAEATDCNDANTVDATDSGTAADIQVLLSDGTVPVVCIAGAFVLADPLTLNRPVELFGLTGAELDGNDVTQIIDASAGSDLTVQNIAFVNGAGFNGGAIYINGSITVENSQFTGNNSATDGGAIFVDGSNEAEIISSTFTGNATGPEDGGTGYSGGAIYSVGSSPVFVVESTFTENVASGLGGAIAAYVVISELSEFTDNSALFGGSVYGAAVIALESTFAGNSAEEGGAVRALLYGATLGSTFVNNSATAFGGALGVGEPGGAPLGYGGVFSLNSTFVDNTSEEGGGAILGDYGQIALSTFLDNEANVGLIFERSDAIYATGDEGSMEVGGNIFAGSRPNAQLGALGEDAYNDLGGNVFSTTEEAESALGTPDATTQFSQSVASLFGAGAGLADNGGPTQTVALIGGSPAIDAVPPLILDVFVAKAESTFAPAQERLEGVSDLIAASDTPDVDQRSVERTEFADAGAYEYGESEPELAATGLDDSATSLLGGLAALLLGIGAAFAIGTRRISRSVR